MVPLNVLVVFGVEHNPRENITFIMEKNLSHMLPVLLNKRFFFLSFFSAKSVCTT